jgi:YegS/Rv2252/BmrU family lipid kinase
MDAWLTIINPVAGNGKAGKDWPKIESLLKQARFDFVPHKTEHQGHAAELVQKGLKQGYRKFLCVGGDGTLHHMVNGIMEQDDVASTEITLAMISVGTGNDWIKTYGIPKDYKSAIRSIKLGKPFLQDVGIARYNQGKDHRFFVNFAGVGFDGEVVKKTGKKFGRLSYLWGLFTSLLGYKTPSLKLGFGEAEREGKYFMVIAGIGQYGGGGMRLMPDAITNDGLLDITMAADLGKMEVIGNLGKLFNGAFTGHPKVEQVKSKDFKVASQQGTAYMEADGEFIGEGPFDIKIIPSALRVLVPDHNFKD